MGGIGLITAPTASAAGYGCGGSLVGQYNIKGSDNSTWGTINVYYSSASGGTNCIVNVAKKYAGTPHGLEVHLFQGSRRADDKGRYSQYAGPVSLSETNGDCITVSGEVSNPSGSTVAIGKWSNVHCG
ncbi:hypothetical protein [Streptomyces sp. NBC_01506]|uniref:hypothetical protein n=1 Tax=Streptomyces sp. NBC_01506 TaxID=2903887 RepID=UPI00386AE619